MFVKDFMTRHPIMVQPEVTAVEAQRIFAENNIRHLPVTGSGKRLLGLVTRDRLALKPDQLNSLNVWEITRYLGSLTVRELMIKAEQVVTISPDRTLERAARIMTERKIGCLPVIEDNVVVGMITEIDLLNAYEVMMGLPEPGIRVTMRMPNRHGEFARLMAALVEHQLGVMGVGIYPAPRAPGYYDAVLKIISVSAEEIKQIFGKVEGQEMIDIREAV